MPVGALGTQPRPCAPRHSAQSRLEPALAATNASLLVSRIYIRTDIVPHGVDAAKFELGIGIAHEIHHLDRSTPARDDKSACKQTQIRS